MSEQGCCADHPIDEESQLGQYFFSAGKEKKNSHRLQEIGALPRFLLPVSALFW
jgi:hypothetical protein